MGKVVAFVRITHDHVLAAGGQDSAHQSVAIALFLNVHHPGAQAAGDFLRTVGAAIVGDYNFAADVMLAQGLLRLFYAGAQRFGFVEARHYDGEFEAGFFLHQVVCAAWGVQQVISLVTHTAPFCRPVRHKLVLLGD